MKVLKKRVHTWQLKEDLIKEKALNRGVSMPLLIDNLDVMTRGLTLAQYCPIWAGVLMDLKRVMLD